MRFSHLASFVLASILAARSGAVTLSSWTQLTEYTYDYVIVGAGTAGLVLANRLSEDPNVSVLVIEAGGSDEGLITTQIPFMSPNLTPDTPYDWNYTVTAQAGLNGRTFAYPRGHILGGSSTINYCVHQYGSNEDWDRLANVSGDSGWAWENMRQYINKHETFAPSVDGRNTTGQYRPDLHGTSGNVQVSLPGYNQTVDSRVLDTVSQSNEWEYLEDTAGGDHSLLGIGWLQSSAGGGVRSSSSTGYLTPANKRPNLTVVTNTLVTQLVQTGVKLLKPSFRAVKLADRVPPANGQPSTSSPPLEKKPVPIPPPPPAQETNKIYARKEVILSAGSVGTPQLLQLSGIGDKKALKALGIKSTVANSNVGENLSDHSLLSSNFYAKGEDSFDHIVRDGNLVNAALGEWIVNKSGLFANNVFNLYGFARLMANASIFETTPDPAAGPNSPHWEIVSANFFYRPGLSMPETGSFFTMASVLVSPTSRGSVKISSSDPYSKPLINPNFLTTDFDVYTMRESVKSVLRFISGPAWKDYYIKPFGSLATATDDATIDAYVREATSTIFHPVGTASIGHAWKPWEGVVNPDLTLKGADGLRIVDASVFPYIPSTHTQGPVYLLAERAADIIKAAATLPVFIPRL